MSHQADCLLLLSPHSGEIVSSLSHYEPQLRAGLRASEQTLPPFSLSRSPPSPGSPPRYADLSVPTSSRDQGHVTRKSRFRVGRDLTRIQPFRVTRRLRNPRDLCVTNPSHATGVTPHASEITDSRNSNPKSEACHVTRAVRPGARDPRIASPNRLSPD